MKVIIAGGRDFNDYELLKDKCNFYLQDYLKFDSKKYTFNPNLEIVSGCAKGTDTLGATYAHYNRIPVREFPADWENLDVEPCIIRTRYDGTKYNAAAGNIRNKLMGEYATNAIIFWNGVSSGSKDMINIMKRLNKPVRIVRY